MRTSPPVGSLMGQVSSPVTRCNWLLPLAIIGATLLGAGLACTVVAPVPGSRLSIVVPTLAIAFVALSLLWVIGSGWSFILGRAIGPAPSIWYDPALGYALLTVLVALPQTYLAGSRYLILTLVLVGVVGTLARIRRAWKTKMSPFGLAGIATPESFLPASLVLVVSIITSIPVVGLGNRLPLIGENQDWVIYATLARWWQDHSALGLLADPRFAQHIVPVTYLPSVGASSSVHLLTALALVTGQDPLDLFVPTLVALRALSVVALWELCRRGFGWSPLRSVASCALLTIMGNQTSILYYSFANQTAALLLLPMALLEWINLLAEPDLQRVFRAGLWLAALFDGYVVLVPHLAAIAGLLLARQLITTHFRTRLATHVACALVAALLVSPCIHNLARQASYLLHFWQPHGAYIATWGNAAVGFVPPVRWVGLAPAIQGTPAWAIAAWGRTVEVAFLIALVSVVLFLLIARGDTTARLVVAGGVMTLAFLYWYPFSYGFNKSITSLGFVTAVGVVGGLAAFRDRLSGLSPKQHAFRTAPFMVLGPILAGIAYLIYFSAVGLTVVADIRDLATNQWREIGPTVGTLQLLLGSLPRGSSVVVVGRDDLAPRLTTIIGYFSVPEVRLTGAYTTYYFSFFTRPSGQEGYALVQGDEPPPSDFEATPTKSVGGFRLYRRDSAIVATWRPKAPVRLDPTTSLRIAASHRRYSINGEALALSSSPPASPVEVWLEVVSAKATEISATDGASKRRVTIAPGMSAAPVGRLSTLGSLTLTGLGTEAAWITSVTLITSDDHATPRLPPSALVGGARVLPDGQVSTEIIVAGTGVWPRRLTFEVNSVARGSNAGWQNWIGRSLPPAPGSAVDETFSPDAVASQITQSEHGPPESQIEVTAYVIADRPGSSDLEAIPVATFGVGNGRARNLRTMSFARFGP